MSSHNVCFKGLAFKVQSDWVTQTVLNSACCVLPGTMFLYAPSLLSSFVWWLKRISGLWKCCWRCIGWSARLYIFANTVFGAKRERTRVYFRGKFPPRLCNHYFLPGGEVGVRHGLECRQPIEARKSKEWHSSLKPPGGTQSCRHPDFSLETPILDFWSPELWASKHVLFQAAKFMVICHGSQQETKAIPRWSPKGRLCLLLMVHLENNVLFGIWMLFWGLIYA